MKKTIKHVLSVCLILLSLTLIFASCADTTTAPSKETEAPSGETTAAPEQTGKVPATDSVGLAYSVNEGGISCTITGIGTCTDTKIGIPETIDGYTVTSIGYKAFAGSTSLTSITIPDSVTSIGTCAFFGCVPLTSITIPDSVTSIGQGAFEGCKSLTSITIPDSVTSIGYKAFADCTSLTSITIPDSMTSIGDSAFYGCTSLTSVTIPDSVTSVEMLAFADCTSIKSVYITDIEKWFSICFELGSNPLFYGADLYLNGKLVTDLVIPDTVTSIGRTFYGCPSLTSITVEDGNPVYHSNGNCLIETGSKTLIAGCSTSVIPDDGSVTSIRDHAFAYCTALTSITLPDSVTSIGHYAFYGCTSLTSITIPDSVTTSIGQGTFEGCEALTSINYSGTIDQWNAIDKDYDWNFKTGDYVIHCTDGDISK